MERHQSVDSYISAHSEYEKELTLLRNLINSCDVVEEVKWGAPCYTVNKKNVVGIAAFKNYFGLWFHQGVFLSDPKKKLINAQEGTTKALRQWRFNSIEEVDEDLVVAYVQEAIQNQLDGKEMKPARAKQVSTPQEMLEKFESDEKLKNAFLMLTPGKQREYSEYIGSAKQEKTRISRLDKCIPLILQGKGLNDKYRK